MRKGLKLFGVIFSAVMLIFTSSFSAFCAENHYYIKELKMNIDLPDEMVAITRESAETDRYFSVFGLDYETTMKNFEKSNIYLQGMYEDSSRIFTVTMVSDENSQNIGNYHELNDDQLVDVENSFLSEQEYTSCTMQRYNDYVFMDLQFKTESDGQTVYANQCNTVVNGNNITLTFQPSKNSQLTNADYQTMSAVLQSIEFSDRNSLTPLSVIEKPVFWYAVIGFVLVAVILIIVVKVLLNRRSRKRRSDEKKIEKKIRNQEILKELAQEFTTPAVNDVSDSKSSYDEEPASPGEESAEDIIKQFRNSEYSEKLRKSQSTAYNETKDEEEIDIVNIRVASQEASVKTESNIPLSSKQENPVLRIVTPDDEASDEESVSADSKTNENSSENSVKNISDEEIDDYDESLENDEDYDDYDEYDEYDEDDYDYEEDDLEDNNEVIGSEESFEQSEDYFDEALDKEEVYSRTNVEDEDKYDESRKISIDPQKAKRKAKTAGAVVLNGILIFLNGVKSFFIHLGYFFTNLARLINRTYKRHKHKKAEMKKRRQQEEARRRRQENLQRKQQRNLEKDANGLVKVHSQRNSSTHRPAERRNSSRTSGTNRPSRPSRPSSTNRTRR